MGSYTVEGMHHTRDLLGSQKHTLEYKAEHKHSIESNCKVRGTSLHPGSSRRSSLLLFQTSQLLLVEPQLWQQELRNYLMLEAALL